MHSVFEVLFSPTVALFQYVGRAAGAAATGVTIVLNQLEEGLVTMAAGNRDICCMDEVKCW
jgi:hypothetical protein